MYGDIWAPYVPVADRRRTAARLLAKLARRGRTLAPIRLKGRAIATTVWGKAWCSNLATYSDYENRLPRGQTYVRNGSVIDLRIEPGMVRALVSGSEIYEVTIGIRPLSKARWATIVRRCAGQIDSAVELLRGQLSDAVMQVMTRERTGLFPPASAISMQCTCPDWATMCKHVAAVLYGVGARLDQEPELLFRLRGVDHRVLIAQAHRRATPVKRKKGGKAAVVADSRLGAVFGIELEGARPAKCPRGRRKPDRL